MQINSIRCVGKNKYVKAITKEVLEKQLQFYAIRNGYKLQTPYAPAH